MNKHKHLRRSTYFLVAALLVASLSITALACGGFNVIYEILTGDATLPVGSEVHDLTDEQPVEFEDYQYTEEDGQIQVFFDESDWDEQDTGDISYEISSGETALPEDAEIFDLTDQDSLEIEDYQYTEQDGQIIVQLDDTATQD